MLARLLTTRPLVRTATVSPDQYRLAIALEGDGVWYLLAEVDLDIARKALGGAASEPATTYRPVEPERPLPFSLFELLDIHRLIPWEVVNLVMTHAQRKLLAQYATHLFKRARDTGDDRRARAYDQLLDELLSGTLITFEL